ncbi:MAG: PaaI family thioesterase [Dehalococcoidia bacterium]
MSLERSVLLKRLKEYAKCFGCGPENPIGLKMNVAWDGQKATAEFVPTEYHTGLPRVTHGGIVATLVDECMSYVPFLMGMDTVTGKLEIRFRNHLRPGEPVRIAAWISRRRGKTVETRATIHQRGGDTLLAEAYGLQFVVKEGEGSDRG